jgi:hypothetical protein
VPKATRSNHEKKPTEREYDFALVIDGVGELTDQVTDALYSAGCDDATFSIQYGRLCAEFSRRAASPEVAILSAIDNICRAGIGATVARIDDCDLVTQADIARRTGRSRQQINQFITGTRGPGHFPPPECHLAEGMPLWRWCAVGHWLAENNIIRAEELWNAKVVATINALLELSHFCKEDPELVKEIQKFVPTV